MRKLIQLAVFAAIVYFGVTQGMPWLQGLIEGTGESVALGFENKMRGDGFACVDKVRDAADYLGGASTVLGSPPYDTGAWANFETRLDGLVGSARSMCGCSEPGCVEGDEALDEVERAAGTYRAAVEGDGNLSNAARELEAVYEMVDRAQSASDVTE